MITVKNLSFTYAGGHKPAIRNLNFVVEPGEIFGFLGPSGAGKSTTQKILNGLLKDYQGQISVLGKELNTWHADYYEHIGVSFELPNHYLRLTALENLNYFRSLYSGLTEDPKKLLEMVGLQEDGDTLVGQYSKGMRMRLNFVRALLHKPELLFLDEPTSGMDPVNAKLIKDLIQSLKDQGRTIFLTTHNMNVADELCDRVAFLVDGEIKLIDTPRALKVRHGQRRIQVEFGLNGQWQQQEFALDGLGRNPEFMNLLQRDDIQTIHTQETSLERIFIQVTGQELE
ncbi:MAG: ABC transporter ATP-binding protein [Chloroflexi bacterium]|nr:ABC transporter ATP-binding protein [Chloroflexota bacterium]MBP8054613.1 ABC transporter ATP-binding protein [Chloroflexota bacterium]